jgi:integrase
MSKGARRISRRILNVAVRKKLPPSNPCWGVEFPAAVKGLFRPHYMSWSEQQRIEAAAPSYLRNLVRIITETGLRIYQELTPMTKDQVDLQNKVVWIIDSKTPNGVADVPLTDISQCSPSGIRYSWRETASNWRATTTTRDTRPRSRRRGG